MLAIPVSSMGFAEKDVADTDYPKSAYFEQVLQQKAVQEMTEQQRSEFIQTIQDQFNKTQYDREVFALLEKVAETEAEIDELEAIGKDTTESTQQLWALVYELEEYGVTTMERIENNSEYWSDKAYEAMKQANQEETTSTSTGSEHGDSIKHVHMSGVVLENKSTVWAPCLAWLSCPNIAAANGLDTKTRVAYVSSYPG